MKRPAWLRLRFRTTPLRPQFQTTECGVAVLRIMLAYFGLDVSTRELREVTGVGRDCLSAGDLRRAAQAYGMTCSARSLEVDHLRHSKLPVIVHLRFIHFVVLEAIDGDRVYLNCPIAGLIEMDQAEFARDFTGITITLRPGPDFTGSGRPIAVSQEERRWWQMILHRMLPATILGCLASVAFGALMLLLASGMIRLDSAHLWYAGAAILGLFIIPRFALQRAGEELYATERKNLLDRFAHVAPAFFLYRHPRVLVWLPDDLRALVTTLTKTLGPALFAALELLILLLGAVRIDPVSGGWLLVTAMSWVIVVTMLSQWARATERALKSDLRDPVNTALSALEHPETARFGHGPVNLQLDMESACAQASMGHARIGIAPWLLRASPLMLTVANVLVVVRHSSHRKSLAGELFLALTIGLAARPFAAMRGVVERIRTLSSRIIDVLEEPSQPAVSSSSHPLREVPEVALLTVNNLHFAFAKGKPLLRGVSLTLSPGERVGLTGASGAGKSTLTEILAGLHSPTAGYIEHDGTPMDSLAAITHSRLLLRVCRRATIFDGTLRDNITLWDPHISEDTLAAAIRDAQLQRVVEDLPGGLNFVVEAGGRNLSGGQLQRVEVARALVRQSRALVLDDALDALDATTERHLLEALRARGCAVLLVTQRTTSLNLCDRVLHLVDGRLISHAMTTPDSQSIPPTHLATHLASTTHQETTCDEQDHRRLETAMRVLAKQQWNETQWLSGRSRTELIRAMADSCNLIARPIRFIVKDWWTTDFGTALAFRADGSPAVIVRRVTHNQVLDPSTGKAHILTPQAARDFCAEAYCFAAIPVTPPLTFSAWSQHLLRATASSSLLLVAPAAAFALSCSILLLRSQIPGTVCLALVSAGLLFLIASAKLVARTEAILARSHANAVTALVSRIVPEVSRTWQPQRLLTAVLGLYDRPAAILDLISQATPSAALLCVLMLAFTRLQGSPQAILLLPLSLACLACPLSLTHLETKLLAKSAQASQRATQWFHRYITAVHTIRSLDRHAATLHKWLERDNMVQRLFMRRFTLHMCVEAAGCAILIVALAWRLHIPVHDLRLAAVAGLALWVSLDLGQTLARFVVSRHSAHHANDLITAPREQGSESSHSHGILTAHNVTMRYASSRRPVLNQVSIDVLPHQITVLAGPSGNGKSTLLRILLGLQTPDSGAIRFNGVPFERLDLQAWRRHVAVILQGEQLEESATIRSHLGGRGVSLSQLSSLLDIVELSDTVHSMPMGLQTMVAPGTLSNGEAQRLLLARALIGSPSLLVLDEATNAVSETMQARIFARLRERGIACLIVTHRASLMNLADAVYELHNSQLSRRSPGAATAINHAEALYV